MKILLPVNFYGKLYLHHGYEPQSKLWKQIPQQAKGLLNPPLRGIVPNSDKSGLNSSTCISCIDSLALNEFHYDLQISIHFVF